MCSLVNCPTIPFHSIHTHITVHFATFVAINSKCKLLMPHICNNNKLLGCCYLLGPKPVQKRVKYKKQQNSNDLSHIKQTFHSHTQRESNNNTTHKSEQNVSQKARRYKLYGRFIHFFVVLSKCNVFPLFLRCLMVKCK